MNKIDPPDCRQGHVYVAAVDPGFAHFGIVIFDVSNGVLDWVNATCISTKKPKDKKSSVAALDATRIKQTLIGSLEFMRTYPLVRMAFELPVGGARSSRATRALAITTCYCEAIPMMLAKPYRHVSPRQVKLAATGDPFAEKDAIIKAMTAKYPQISDFNKGDQEHISDAVGVGLVEKQWLISGEEK
jgi:Holliday junction resolvasome RuvABC endonuclease subunit